MKKGKIISSLLIVALMALFMGSSINVVQAAAITSASDTMSSSKISTASSHIIKFTTPTGANESTDTIIITFPSDFNFTSKAINTVTFTHGATTGAETTETLAASPDGSNWGAVFSGTQLRVLTLTAPTDGTGAAAIAASDKIILTYDSSNSTNGSSATSYAIAVSGTFGDSGNITVTLLSDDQVAVTATVSQSLTFSISDNTIEFGTLSASAAQYADDSAGNSSETEAHTIIIGTNASNGYTATVKGATLTSGAYTITALGSNTASSAGSEQFGLRMTATGGSGAVTAPYAASGFAYTGTAGTAAQVASASGASSNTTYSVRYLANITSSTEAGSYTATLTYVATGNF